MDNTLPVPQPTNAAVDSGSTHEGAPVQGMSSRGENLPAYQNMSQILFHENLKLVQKIQVGLIQIQPLT